MNMILRAKGVDLDGAVKDFVRVSLHSALGRFSEHVEAVDVFISDVNGPKGGIDKQVLARVRLATGQVVATETTGEDFYAALSSSAKTTKRAVRRSLKKSQRLERHSFRTAAHNVLLDS